MRSKKIYKSVSINDLKCIVNQFQNDATVDYFEIQVSKEHGTISEKSSRLYGLVT